MTQDLSDDSMVYYSIIVDAGNLKALQIINILSFTIMMFYISFTDKPFLLFTINLLSTLNTQYKIYMIKHHHKHDKIFDLRITEFNSNEY